MGDKGNNEAEAMREGQDASASALAAGPAGELGPEHLSPTQKRLMAVIASHQVGDGYVAFSKHDLSVILGRCEKTIDRVVASLRRRGLIEAKPRFSETGGQISSAYRVTSLAREKYPALIG